MAMNFGIQEKMDNWEGPGPGPKQVDSGFSKGTTTANPPANPPYDPPTYDPGPSPMRTGTNDAETTLKAILDQYGLGDLGTVLYKNYTTGMIDINNPDAILYSIKNEAAYQKRFAANAARVKAGLPELDPASYVALEKYYRDTMRSNGLPANFYDSTDDFNNLIAGDVSPAELQARITEGYNAVAQADPTVKAEFARLYNIGDGELAAYFLDPTKAAPILKEQARASQIAASGKEQANIMLDVNTAQNLAQRGYSQQEAQSAFSAIGKLGELNQTFAGETSMTQEQQIGAAFGYDVQAQKQLEQKRRGRVAEFASGGSFAGQRGSAGGLGTAE